MALERKHVTEEFIHICKTSSSSQRLHVEVPRARFVYELCWTVVRGDLLVNKFRLAWESVEFAETVIEEDSASLLADTIAHMGQESIMSGEFRARLIELAKWLVDNGLVSTRLLQERCEAEFLWEADMIKIRAPDLKSKEVRVNTRLLYQQTKFNLLREESEGYAKLVTLLSRRGQAGSNKQRAAVVISTIKSLIGHFDLDPNRVFDIVLECFELQPQNTDFLELIPLFPKSHTSHILGFKFQYYQRPEVNENVPDGLYILSATLVKANFIDLESVLAHLLPADEDAFAEYEAFSKRHLDDANKIGKINLAATGKDLMEEDKPGDVTIDLFAALDIENEATLERSHEFSSNQKLGLLRGFLLIGDWHHAYILFERFANLNPVSSPQICDSLFRLIENVLASSYKLVRPPYLANLGVNIVLSGVLESTTNYCSQSSEVLELNKEFFQMLSCAGPYLYRDALLLQKVCRVLRGYLSCALSNASNESFSVSHESDYKDPKSYLKDAQFRIQDALGNCLLPSLQLLPANPAVGIEIWEVMSLLPYEARYRLYGEWEKEDEKIPMIVAARQTAKKSEEAIGLSYERIVVLSDIFGILVQYELDTRRILKRLAKENLKQLGRMVAKIAHANPMTVLRTIVHQIEAYKDMITPVVDAFKYLTQLEYDVLEYVVIERLAQGGRDKLKEDGLNLSDWLQSLAFFWGHLCKKYPSMELRGLFQYLVNKLKKDEGIELIVLQELIQQMANVEYTENVTEEQLEAMAGGESLRYHGTAFGATRNNKALLKSTNRLRDSLLPKDEPKLAVPLLLLIAQHRSKVIINADAPYIKMVSERFDRCHGALLQYVEFLTNAVTPTPAYAQLIPSLDELLHKYHIEPEVCFLIYRPVMRMFKPANKAEPIESGKSPSEAFSGKENWPLNSSNELVLDLGATRKVMMWSELLSTVHSILPSKSWNSLSPELYTTFWGLSLQDLFVPRKRYEAEIAKQRATLKALEENSDNSHTAITKRKKDKIKIQEVLDRLTSELQQQEHNAKAVHERLVKEKDSWLTSCPDLIKVNMEFLQRCIFPRCVVSMIDAIYCARFVHTLHSLGTPFFNTVNHIDVLICKTLQPMICSCTEYEASRFGRFLCETLKMAYYWKSQEAIYDKECGNMPGFAVLYRDPNSARVTFSQFLRVHIKWSNRITKLLIQCLESSEYIEIRNALTILTKISSVFPVIRKTGINLERRVNKIKGDEREDLKVLATGVAAALAARKGSWVTEEEFVMGLIDVKPTASPAKISGAPSASASNIQLEHAVQQGDLIDQGKPTEASGDQARALQAKSEPVHSSMKPVTSVKELSLAQAAANAQAEASRSALSGAKHVDEVSLRAIHAVPVDENSNKVPQKHAHTENEGRARRIGAGGVDSARANKLEIGRDESKLASNVSFGATSAFVDREVGNRAQESVRQRPGSNTISSTIVTNGTTAPATSKGSVEKKGSESSAKIRSVTDAASDGESKKLNEIKNLGERETEMSEVSVRHVSKSPLKEDSKPVEEMPKEKVTKRSSLVDEIDRTTKRRKGDVEKTGEAVEYRIVERERVSERPRSVEHEKTFYEERTAFDKALDSRVERARERLGDRTDREHRGVRDEHIVDRTRGRSMERFTRERSVERVSGFDRPADRSREERLKDDRSRARYTEVPIEQPHADDRFPMQNLPPPPPLPPNIVPQSMPSNRREEEESRRTGRQPGRTSPRKDEKAEKRRSEDASMNSVEDSRRKDEDSRDRKRDDREAPTAKVDKERDKDRDKEKAILLKEDDSAAAISKRRRLKRDHISSEVPTNFGPTPPPPPLPTVVAQQYDRDRERKNAIAMRNIYEEPGYDKGPNSRIHGKDMGKIARREHEQPYEQRDWDEDKRARGDMKRRHHR